MSKTILLAENESDFQGACQRLKQRGEFRSAMPPYLIESSVDVDLAILSDFPQVRVFHDVVPEEVLAQLPFNVQLALRAYLQPPEVHKTPDSAEGVAWDAPEYEAPGQPGPHD